MNPMNPYHPDHGDEPMAEIWDAGFAAGRAAATPDPPDMTNMCEGESPDHKPGITPAASPDERLREAGERLAQAVARVCGEGHPALGMWRVALAAADREAPDEPKETTT